MNNGYINNNQTNEVSIDQFGIVPLAHIHSKYATRLLLNQINYKLFDSGVKQLVAKLLWTINFEYVLMVWKQYCTEREIEVNKYMSAVRETTERNPKTREERKKKVNEKATIVSFYTCMNEWHECIHI